MISESTQEHRRKAPRTVTVSILTVSDTRTLENDLGGQLIEQQIVAAGHVVLHREIVVDETLQIREAAQRLIDSDTCEALLITGGTGLAARDCTPEAIEPLMMPAFLAMESCSVCCRSRKSAPHRCLVGPVVAEWERKLF